MEGGSESEDSVYIQFKRHEKNLTSRMAFIRLFLIVQLRGGGRILIIIIDSLAI